ncbi:Reverse transcriptase (RNA-dependent DNA polymerase) [Maridesulfovibrio ferrireducens]|uniref:RNA-directed DNA polymerase n=1 Tax=Maridesulfovibrio ferrireducens TaxID=246191 RepID=A0A1G9FSW1_9BACT|nr:retron St85 family RNA-directed DNA polymerase [Maridesulfovibrio ferrireducens]SDK91213.1 Reverse transcriptase (RNA-dependent DNA polymerase) [Maridesulfovibrio ferrireducens]
MPDKLNLVGKLSFFLGASEEDIKTSANSMSRKYKQYKIPKKNGGSRTILHPCRPLKALQYAIHEVLLNKLEVHPIAHAYVPNQKSPLKQSAKAHTNYKYTIRIDFENFFPSIRPEDLELQINKNFILSKTDKYLLRTVLFYQKNRGSRPILPIGAPTSPTISNIVMFNLDELLLKTSKEHDRDSALTRYADDIYFSTNIKGCCKLFYDEIFQLLKRIDSPRLKINTNKTLFLSKGTKRVVNGLFVTPNGKVSIGRKRKTQIKSLIYKHSQTALMGKELLQTRGLLAFIQDCEPEFYNTLALKYGVHFYSIKES